VIGTGDLSNARLARTFLELRGACFAAAFIAGATLAVGGAKGEYPLRAIGEHPPDIEPCA
jgi:hypothetical protein